MKTKNKYTHETRASAFVLFIPFVVVVVVGHGCQAKAIMFSFPVALRNLWEQFSKLIILNENEHNKVKAKQLLRVQVFVCVCGRSS